MSSDQLEPSGNESSEPIESSGSDEVIESSGSDEVIETPEITPVILDYPHDVAVIFQNPADTPLVVSCLGKHGITFAPREIIAVIGNPLLFPPNPQRYNGMASVDRLHRLIAGGQLVVLSTPTAKNINVVVGSGVPNTRIVTK